MVFEFSDIYGLLGTNYLNSSANILILAPIFQNTVFLRGRGEDLQKKLLRFRNRCSSVKKNRFAYPLDSQLELRKLTLSILGHLQW